MEEAAPPTEPGRRDEALAAALDALSSPTRLAILRELRTPRALREIDVRVDGRPLARQTVRQHLDRLIEAGIAQGLKGQRAYGSTAEYVVNHQRVFATSEEVRSLARLRPLVEPASETAHAPPARRPEPERPCFALVKGLDEGATFDLRPLADGKRTWIIGRRRGVDVPLDFDPYVSAENARVVWEEGRHHIEDVPGSRNGTWVNFHPLAADERHALRHGDVVGVGRSFLVYWA